MCNNMYNNICDNAFNNRCNNGYYVFGKVNVYPIYNRPYCRCGCGGYPVPYMAMMPYVNYCMTGNGYGISNYRPFGAIDRDGGLYGSDC